MAKVHEEVIVIKLSRLVKGNQTPESVVTEDVLSALEQVTQELVGNDVIAEVEYSA